MEAGFVVDKGDGNLPGVGTWFSGVPAKAWWGGLKTKGHEQREVSTWGCRKCGCLESYAGPDVLK